MMRAVYEGLLEDLRQRASDRPAHAAFLEVLLESEEPMQVAWGELPRGVSLRVAEALADDVDWIKAGLAGAYDDRSVFHSGYPNAYDQRRLTDSRAAYERARRRQSLEALLKLPGKKG